MTSALPSMRERFDAVRRRLWRRLLSTSSANAAMFAGGTLVVFVGASFAIALAMAVFAAASGEAPAWLSDWIRDKILAGNSRVKFTVEYLMRWGLDEALRSLLGQILMIGGVLLGTLVALRLIKRTIRLLPWVLDRAMAKPVLPRLHLTRPLRVTVRDSSKAYQHQFDMHVDFVLVKGADFGAIISKLSTVCPIMLRAARDVIDHSDASVSTEEIGDALTRSARKYDKRIHHIELREVAYAMIGPKGDVMFTQNLPVAA